MQPVRHEYDVLIVGSGAAGLALALHLPGHARVAILSKGDLTQGSTFQAQGGMAAVLDDDDRVDFHVGDTMAAGAGLCHQDVVEFVVSRGRAVVDWLVALGVEFDPSSMEPPATGATALMCFLGNLRVEC